MLPNWSREMMRPWGRITTGRILIHRTVALLVIVASTPKCTTAHRSSFVGARHNKLDAPRATTLSPVAPRPTKRHLEELTDIDGSAGFGYGECQGDCDYDWQCSGNLVCFQRDGYAAVPNCKGDGTFDVDYCHYPDIEYVDYPSLIFLGVYVKGMLGTCSGDCDSDDDCRDGLKCFDTPGIDTVPGCGGVRRDDIDFCYDPANDNLALPTDSEQLLYVGKDIGEPLGKCIGDCRVNSDCRGSLECYEKDGLFVPGCSGVRQEGVDYCWDPNSADAVQFSGTLAYVGDDYGPLDVCMGDCDYDSDCQPGLKCAQRPGDGTYHVFGCDGKVERWIEYCYDPHWNPSAGATTNNNVVEPSPEPTMEPSLEPTTEPSPNPTLEPSLSPTVEPSPTPTANPTHSPSSVETSVAPTSSPNDLILSSQTNQPAPLPTSSQSSGKPVETEKVFVQVSPFVLELSFLTPTRALAAKDMHGRYVLFKESIDEHNELLGIIGSILGESFRLLSPSSYVGLLLEVSFLEEVKELEGITKVAYVFTGKAIFANDADFTIPFAEETKTTVLDALDEDLLLSELRQSGNDVLEAVKFVSISLYNEREAGISNLSGQDNDGPNNSGIKIGAFVLIGVVVACVAVVGGGYIYMKRKDSTFGFWRRPGRADRKDDRKATTTAPSTGIIGAIPSPARTKDLSFDSKDNHVYCKNESWVESELSVPDFGDSSSAGGTTSDWSYNANAYGYSSGGDDASGSVRAITPKAPDAEAFIASSAVVFNVTKDGPRAQSFGYGGQTDSSQGASVSTGTGSMSALDEVKLGSVLKVDDGRADSKGRIQSTSISDRGNANHPDFKELWKKSACSSPARESIASQRIGERIFGASHPDQLLHMSQSHSTDAEDILKTLERSRNDDAAVSGSPGRSLCVGNIVVENESNVELQ